MFPDLTLSIAFTAGVVSFFSPCFFPVLPGFFALMAAGEKEVHGERVPAGIRTRLSNLYVSLAFIFGFTAVFFVIGLAFQNTLEYSGLFALRKTLATLGGFLIMFFGVVMMGVIPERYTARMLGGSQVGGRFFARITSMLSRGRRHTFVFFKGVAAFFFGAGFAAAWSPCIGAVLGSVLSLTLAHPEQGLALFISYMLGFGIPLLVLGFFAEELGHLIEKVNTQTVHVQSIFGSVLVVIGMFMVLFPPEQVLKCF